ncbi:MAG TPA: hypothetical protein VHH36_04615 [Candidatus Thermoplasmatota archaeon]|nr:hypothetical protein [Candidatus Thermoplasmatota archaeon]
MTEERIDKHREDQPQDPHAPIEQGGQVSSGVQTGPLRGSETRPVPGPIPKATTERGEKLGEEP